MSLEENAVFEIWINCIYKKFDKNLCLAVWQGFFQLCLHAFGKNCDRLHPCCIKDDFITIILI